MWSLARNVIEFYMFLLRPALQVASMQRDSATYVDEPEDAEDFAAWRGSSFSMSSAQPEIDKILSGR